jgi:predicted deacylase
LKGKLMLDGFDPTVEGKHLYDLRPLVPADDTLKEDVICIIRNGEGPTALLCGGIHGDEYEPQVILRQLIDEIAVEDVRGRLIIIPTINPPASQRGSRVSTIDGQNMNRSFPGNAEGTGTERLSAFLHDVVFPLTDLLVDVHSGGGDYFVVPMIFGFTGPECGVDEAGLDRIMDGWGYPIVQYVEGIASTSAGASPLVGVASVEIEGGGGRAVKSSELAIMREGILRGLHAYGVLATGPGGMSRPPIRVAVSAENNHAAPSEGLIEHRVDLHDRVEAGDLLAVLHPAAGRTGAALEIRANGPGIVLRQRARFFVGKGELICGTGNLRM